MKKALPLLAGWLLAGATVQPLPATINVPKPTKRPNILWISCEDMSPRLGCYGDSTVPTPNIDRLAREGIRFTNAFTTAGVCAPSRSAIITGMYQTSTGGHNMRTLEITNPQKTGLPREYSIVPPPQVRAFPEYLRAATEGSARSPGYYCTNNIKQDYQFVAPPTVWDENSKQAHYRNRTPGQPFFAVFNLETTHESQVWARAKNPLRVDPARVTVPPIYPDTKTVRQDIARFYSNISEMDDEVGRIMTDLEASGELANTIVFFWSDHGDGLPYIKREITDRGLRVPLIVRFPDGRGKGTTYPGLMSMIDLGPTVLSLAGIKPPAHMHGRPLFGTYAAKQPRQYVFAARDRLDSEYDRVRSVHDGRYQYVRNFRPELSPYMDVAFRKQQPMMAEMLRMRDAGQLNAVQMQWFRPTKDPEELYDTKTDPYQLTNLANRPDMAGHLKRLRTQLDRWLAETGDLGAVPEKELVRRWWNGGTEPPKTEAPTFAATGNRVALASRTEGASIGYKLKGKHTAWQVYQQPVALQKGDTLLATAMRIGYQRSPDVRYVP